MRIGIPRALMYYEFFPMWHTFFRALGAEVVLSDKTTKKTIKDGAECCVSDACLPVKVFHGHVVDLIRKKVDALFIPRLISIAEGEFVCPKFTGLPDMVRFSIKNLPLVIDTPFDLRKSVRNIRAFFYGAGSYITRDKAYIREAANIAIERYLIFGDTVREGALPAEIMGDIDTLPMLDVQHSLRIALLGHPYNINDSCVNMNLVSKLAKAGAAAIIPEMLDEAVIGECAGRLDKPVFWTFGRRQIGAAIHLAECSGADGFIYVMSFGCGVDSFMSDLSERRVRRESNLPFMLMVLDEQSGEAGADTRLEAFIDMIRRNKVESNLPAYR